MTHSGNREDAIIGTEGSKLQDKNEKHLDAHVLSWGVI